jgi:hypothetical protein
MSQTARKPGRTGLRLTASWNLRWQQQSGAVLLAAIGYRCDNRTNAAKRAAVFDPAAQVSEGFGCQASSLSGSQPPIIRSSAVSISAIAFWIGG